MEFYTLADTHWFWLSVALVFVILEVFSGGFLALGAAVGAVGLALIAAIAPDATITENPYMMTAVGAAIWIVSSIVLRRIFGANKPIIAQEDPNKRDR